MVSGRRAPPDAKRNNFDLLRITAALAVLVSHSFALTGHVEPALPGGTALGAAGVLVFFAISGHLVTASWQRDPQVWRFALRRGLRIFPALVVVLLLTTLVLGPVVTDLSVHDYLLDSGTHRYVAANLTMVRMQFDLPGVFGNLPFPDSVNGSLWSLRPELHAYVGVAALGLGGLLQARAGAAAALALVTLVLVVAPGPVATAFGEPGPLLTFAGGAALLLWRDRIPWSWWVVAVLVAGVVLVPPGRVATVWTAMSFAYVVLMLGLRTPPVGPRVLRGHDLSYGTYLYAFPVQQTVLWLAGDVGPAGLVALSLPITLVLAACSWRYVESPALRLKSRTLRRSRPAAEHAVTATA